MADDKTPSEADVQAANEAELAKWEGDFKEEDLEVKYKRETSNENDDDKKKEDEGAEDDPSDTGEPSDEEDTEVAPEAPDVPQNTVADPGEYKPADYSFEVTLADGKKVTIKTPEDAEKLAEDADNFETPAQLMDFINKQNKMNRQLERDYEKWEAQHKTFSEQVENESQRREQVESYISEFQYLVGKGLLPSVPQRFAQANWSDPEVAKQPGVKEQLALIKYMDKENGIREKAGIKPLTSIVDAFNAWQLENEHKAAFNENKAAGEARKAAGAKVAGVSPAQQGGYVPKGIAVGNPNVLKRGASVWDN